jgi:copper chaperone
VNTFEVKDMTCGHCVSTITTAVKARDPGAQVRFELATHRVEIESSDTDATKWSDVIREAGYTPVAVQGATRSATSDVAPVRSGCCCG